MHWNDIRFWIAVAGFCVMTCFYISETRESARLYDVVEAAQTLTSDCINHEQARVDTLAHAVGAALTGRSVN